jgi:hypothetical protein
MVRQGFSSRLIPWLPNYFFASGDNEGLGVFLLTLPTFSALGYSIGIALVGTRSRWEKLTGLSPISSVATITVAWVVLFSALALLAHGFERSRIDKWSRVRTVVDRPGLWLSTDANQLCSARTSTAGPLLPTGTKVEGMERRVCFNSRLLDEDALAPAGSWSMERVKVLNGSNGKVEGWVPSYGLLETLKQ